MSDINYRNEGFVIIFNESQTELICWLNQFTQILNIFSKQSNEYNQNEGIKDNIEGKNWALA